MALESFENNMARMLAIHLTIDYTSSSMLDELGLTRPHKVPVVIGRQAR